MCFRRASNFRTVYQLALPINRIFACSLGEGLNFKHYCQSLFSRVPLCKIHFERGEHLLPFSLDLWSSMMPPVCTVWSNCIPSRTLGLTTKKDAAFLPVGTGRWTSGSVNLCQSLGRRVSREKIPIQVTCWSRSFLIYHCGINSLSLYGWGGVYVCVCVWESRPGERWDLCNNYM